MNIVLIGAGNVATHLGCALKEKGFSIAQVYSRTLASAQNLGEKLQTAYTEEIAEIIPNADVYLFSVKDSVLEDIIRQISKNHGLWIHTAGSISIDVFSGYTDRYGVLYPLQTFSKNRKITFDNIPLFIETHFPEDEKILSEIASQLSGTVVPLSSEKRKQLHLAAVFACNFTNHLYTLSAQILEKQDLPWNYLIPLIEETALKIKTLHPKEAQTGPAVRNDTNVMNKQLDLLADDAKMQQIYRILSESISR
ncbi:hypothetical protein FACS189413_06550 [Bacteroidia bacterium]|nr:hypothetical protein FACS189413_06550 [Bacteroidia bacterium]